MDNIDQSGASPSGIVTISSLIGIGACLGDLFMTHLLGTWYSGYRPFFQPMSDLGHVDSPVARLTSNWWVILGVLFLIFGYGFYKAFAHRGKAVKAAAWMIALYGLGEGLGSGLVPGTPGNDLLNLNSIVHNLLGGLGVLGVVFLPFYVMKIYSARQSPYMYWYSWFTTAAGISFFLLFAISKFYQPEGSWIIYHGLWQRLWMLIYYLFFICLALLMLVRRKTAPI